MNINHPMGAKIHTLRVNWPSGNSTFVRNELGQRKQYSQIVDAERDKAMMENLAASRVRYQPGYVPPTYEVVTLP